jgi:hypothetical protein
MAGGRQGSRTRTLGSIERGGLGSGMMSDDNRNDTDITKRPSAAEQGRPSAADAGAKTGSDLQTELEKVDRDALKR